jgi:alkyl hydroperoxide reductase subunit D
MLNETLNDLLLDLALSTDYTNQSLNTLIEGNSKYLRDLRMNYKGFLKSKDLSEKEVYLISVAITNNNGNTTLEKQFSIKAIESGANAEEVADAIACASLLSTNNVLYRFRHFAGKESYEQMRAGLRMNIMLNPVLGKEFFELVSLAVSAVNGCEQCVRSHEASLVELGCSESRIFEAIKLSSVITSLGKIIYYQLMKY